MNYNNSFDSSGTDDDLPPHQNRVSRGGRVAGNGRTIVGGRAYPGVPNDMETEIHQLEQEAYSSVLRAFKAQSDAITWEKESLITELRKELRVSDEEHRVLLGRVNADDIIRRIREWRQAGSLQPGFPSVSQPVHDTITSPSVSGSRKRQKTLQSVPSLSLGAPSPSSQQQAFANSMQPSVSAMKRGAAPGARSKKPKSSIQYPSMRPTGRGQIVSRDSVAVRANEPAEAFDPLIGRKVLSRWPEDNNFYEAVICGYDAEKGLHRLVYDMNTPDEAFEWVNLKEISPEDIRWEDGDDPGAFNQTGRSGPGHGAKTSRGTATTGAGRGRGGPKYQNKKDFRSSQNGVKNKGSDEIEILHTDTLIKEVERVFASSHPDPLEMEKAKKVLKEHEQTLVDVLSKLADASDCESEKGERPSHSQGQMQGEQQHGNDNQGNNSMAMVEG